MICPSASRLRRHTSGLEFDTRPIGHSFIVDHPKVMDFCACMHYSLRHQIDPELLALCSPRVSRRTRLHSVVRSITLGAEQSD